MRISSNSACSGIGLLILTLKNMGNTAPEFVSEGILGDDCIAQACLNL